MKPSKWEVIVVCLLWLAVGLWYLASVATPIGPERVPGARDAWAKCDGTPEEKRVVARKVAAMLEEFAAFLEEDGRTASPKIKTAQHAARLRYEHAKTKLAGTGFCNRGCRYEPVASVASAYLAGHLGVAKDYKLDELFPGRNDRTARDQWVIVARNLARGLMESCP